MILVNEPYLLSKVCDFRTKIIRPPDQCERDDVLIQQSWTSCDDVFKQPECLVLMHCSWICYNQVGNSIDPEIYFRKSIRNPNAQFTKMQKKDQHSFVKAPHNESVNF